MTIQKIMFFILRISDKIIKEILHKKWEQISKSLRKQTEPTRNRPTVELWLVGWSKLTWDQWCGSGSRMPKIAENAPILPKKKFKFKLYFIKYNIFYKNLIPLINLLGIFPFFSGNFLPNGSASGSVWRPMRIQDPHPHYNQCGSTSLAEAMRSITWKSSSPVSSIMSSARRLEGESSRLSLKNSRFWGDLHTTTSIIKTSIQTEMRKRWILKSE